MRSWGVINVTLQTKGKPQPEAPEKVTMKKSKSKLKGRPRGRPRLRYKGLAIVTRLPPNELKALDRWIKADGGLLSRQ